MVDLGRYFWPLLGLVTIAFHLGLIFSGLVPNLIARPLHMALALPWILLFAASSGWARSTGAILTVLGVAACLWVAWNQSMPSDQYGFLEGDLQVAIAAILLLVVLEAARRAIGWRAKCSCGLPMGTSTPAPLSTSPSSTQTKKSSEASTRRYPEDQK